jgi:hypothetical protein
MSITLNLSGQIFQVTPTTLSKIPYFQNMFETCDNTPNETIFVERSPHIFKHVIALAIDPLYPYPKKYAFELDFYDMTYSKNNLYDKHQELMNKVDIIGSELEEVKKDLTYEFKEVNNKMDNMEKELENIKENLSSNGSFINREKCLYNYEDHCDEPPYGDDNYCATHYEIGKYCDKGGCTRLKKGRRFCDLHE